MTPSSTAVISAMPLKWSPASGHAPYAFREDKALQSTIVGVA
jgi:hypothetical protein